MLQEFINCDQSKQDRDLFKVCRICLATDMKLYPISKNQLKEAYQNITGLQVDDEDHLPRMLCMECAYRLCNYSTFRNKSIRADNILREILHKQRHISLKFIDQINRRTNGLTSNLQTKHFEADYYDLHHDDSNTRWNLEEQRIEETIQEEKKEYIVTIKTEDEAFANEVIRNEGFANEVIRNEAVNNEVIENEVKYEDRTFSDDTYSSSDSLPLELCKTKKSKKKVQLKKVKKKQIEPKIDRRRKPLLNPDLSGNLFTVTDLTFEEQMADILKRRDSANYKNAPLKCDKCYKGFNDAVAYNTHMRKHSNVNGAYECEICKTHFKKNAALRKHITAHHTQRFSCNQCVYETMHRQSARLHEKWHKGTQYKCPHCTEVFQKFTTYMGHVRIKHPSDFVCQLCGYSFVSQKGIELHKSLKHRFDETEMIPDDGPLCEPCNIIFLSIDAYNKHLEVSGKHIAPTEGKKKRNDRGYEQRKQVKRPEEKNLITDKGPIDCEQCGVQLPNNRAYHSHFRRMHPDKNRTNYPSMKAPCMCEVCGKLFQSQSLLKDHCWVHTGELPFKCDVCGKSFRMRQRLVTHKKVHLPSKPRYQCNVCGKHFSTQSNKQRHMIIHTGLKPYKCEMCGKSFKHSGEKRAHILYVHLKKPWPKRARGKKRPSVPNCPTPVPCPAVPTVNTWPCDNKMAEVAEIIDKSVYYNLKL